MTFTGPSKIAVAFILGTTTVGNFVVWATPDASHSTGTCKGRSAKHVRVNSPVIIAVVPDSFTYVIPNNTGIPDPKFVTLLIRGKNFGPKSLALWNGKGLATHYLSPTQIEASVPWRWISDVAELAMRQGSRPDEVPGKARITVRSAGFRSSPSKPATFLINTVVVGG